MWVSYTVFLSCLSSLEENSLRMSRNARLRGGLPSPCGLGSLKANSIPSLNTENTHPVTLTKTNCCPFSTEMVLILMLVPEFNSYLWSIAMASLVLIWSSPNVSEKRRASSLIPQNADVDRSKLQPRSFSISLNSWNTNITLVLFSLAGSAVWVRREALPHLLQAEDQSLGTLNPVNLTCFTHGLLNDITVIIIVLHTDRDRE